MAPIEAVDVFVQVAVRGVGEMKSSDLVRRSVVTPAKDWIMAHPWVSYNLQDHCEIDIAKS